MTAFWVWLGGAAAYLVLAGQLSPDEIAAAVLLGGLGAGWHFAVMHDGARTFRFERPALRTVGTSFAGLPGATLRVGARLAAALVRPVAGRRVEHDFHRGTADDPRDRGRRAVVVLATSLAPDSYALDLPLDEETIVFHALTASGPSRDPRWPS
ncbi:hypothetical protein D3273_09700 [Lichenibacterium minor]|uniref:Uncharacterized protein n=1 Tax=Lichenibacterium minor TaxID=2316528 RepID=A0A4Q2U7E3_9HYPH|nr:hypothetical protein [Lichenibacterium minor]RYC32292.1 hypothetical protein D3273_09700 [Lichenibacterium minor]